MALETGYNTTSLPLEFKFTKNNFVYLKIIPQQ